MILKKILPLSLFFVMVLSVNGQVKQEPSTPAQTQITGQPAPAKQQKKKCWFSRKKKTAASKPAAKDALKDRNTRDPKIDSLSNPGMRSASPAALKDLK
ncbi:hypothetical protein [Niabella hirudinis]|uniref:hypothetical protein n=1 Tax=Niabella hirudinis TaxID=1285929 RepID=UPI003EBE0BE4